MARARPPLASPPAAASRAGRQAAAAAVGNRRSMAALSVCIVIACAGILLISRTGGGGARGGGAGAFGGELARAAASAAAATAEAAESQSSSAAASAHVGESIAAARSRRRRERDQAAAREVVATQASAAASASAAAHGDDGKSSSSEAAGPSAESCGVADEQRLVLPDLGFDYPELHAVKRRLRRALACTAPCPLAAVRRAYAQAMGEALGGGGGAGGGYEWGPGGLLAPYFASSPSSSSSCPAAAERELRAFVRAALAALLLDGRGGDGGAGNSDGPLLPAGALEQQLAPCPERDPTLPPFPPGARLLLASNLRDAGRSAPSAAVQAVRLALALAPGALAVGAHEGRSSDRTPFALSVLRLMLLPLRVPQNVTTGARADPPDADALPRIERMAALRNAALAPWLGPGLGLGGVQLRRQRRQQGAAGDDGEEDAATMPAADEAALALALGVLPVPSGAEGGGEEGDAAGDRRRPQHLAPLARPDVVAFANDAIFCAEDVLRLAAHRAPIACGFDFYSAPWQVAAAEQAHQRRSSSRTGGRVKQQQRQRRNAGAGAGDDDDTDELAEDPAVRRDYEEDYDTEKLREPKVERTEEEDAGKGNGKEGGPGGREGEGAGRGAPALPPGRGAARHYDKWVSRDRLGARLSNRPPYVRDEASARELSRGMPVAAYCCWNGLALLDAGPLQAPAGRGRGGGAARRRWWWSAAPSAAGGGGARGGAVDEEEEEEGGESGGGGVTFRAGGHPHDCPASSECSLLCDDYRRTAEAATAASTTATATAYRAVLDPAVRLAYDPAQSRALFAGAGQSGSAVSSSSSSIPGFDVAPVDRTLGPRRRWADVAAAAARLAEAAPVRPGSVDCCSLRPGKNFVRFRSDCAPLEWKD